MIEFKSQNIFLLNYFWSFLLFSRELFHKEHEFLSQLNHPNLVQFYGYTIEQNYAVIEHSDLGDLHTYLLTTQNIS